MFYRWVLFLRVEIHTETYVVGQLTLLLTTKEVFQYLGMCQNAQLPAADKMFQRPTVTHILYYIIKVQLIAAEYRDCRQLTLKFSLNTNGI